jgi:hypothetical protein
MSLGCKVVYDTARIGMIIQMYRIQSLPPRSLQPKEGHEKIHKIKESQKYVNSCIMQYYDNAG